MSEITDIQKEFKKSVERQLYLMGNGNTPLSILKKRMVDLLDRLLTEAEMLETDRAEYLIESLELALAHTRVGLKKSKSGWEDLLLYLSDLFDSDTHIDQNDSFRDEIKSHITKGMPFKGVKLG